MSKLAKRANRCTKKIIDGRTDPIFVKASLLKINQYCAIFAAFV